MSPRLPHCCARSLFAADRGVVWCLSRATLLEGKAEKQEAKRGGRSQLEKLGPEQEQREVLEAVLASVQSELEMQRKKTVDLVEQLATKEAALRAHGQALHDCKLTLKVCVKFAAALPMCLFARLVDRDRRARADQARAAAGQGGARAR